MKLEDLLKTGMPFNDDILEYDQGFVEEMFMDNHVELDPFDQMVLDDIKQNGAYIDHKEEWRE